MILSVFYEHLIQICDQTGKSMEEILGIVRVSGIQKVEIEDTRLSDDSTENKIYNQLRGCDMGINCIYAFFDFGYKDEMNRAKQLIELAKQVKSPRILIIPGYLREDAMNDGKKKEECIRRMIQAVSEICNLAKKEGILVTMEDFDDDHTPFANTEGLLTFVKAVPELKIAFDTGNFLYSEKDALEALEQLLPYIGHVHCKDRTFEVNSKEEYKDTIQGRRMYPAAVGSGCIPMEEIVQRILDSGYDGPIAIEHFGAADQLSYLLQSADWLRSQIEVRNRRLLR